MLYKSTRGGEEVSLKQAVLQGPAKDGGLFVPEKFPHLSWQDWVNLSYKEVAKKVLSLFFDKEWDLTTILNAYDDKFPEEVVKLRKAEAGTILELFHGPTAAFKDMALALLPGFLSQGAAKEGKRVRVLTATSGDTGKAALEGFRDIPGTEIAVFYPHGGVSPVQALQMQTQEGNNVKVYGVHGNFDHAQRGVKEILNDEKLRERMAGKNLIFSSANSINIGRLLPQIVYYVYGYLGMVKNGEIQAKEKIHVSVPTGNFGNILAAYYAKQMGLPIDKLIAVSNDNRVLTDFFEQGNYDANRPLILTSSPSMDILISSNLERLLYHLSAEDTALIQKVMRDLKEKGRYDWKLENCGEFISYSFGERECGQWIKKLWEQNILSDPHSALAYGGANKYKEEHRDDRKILIAATASPFKFPQKVLESLGQNAPKDPWAQLTLLEELSGLSMPKPIEELKKKKLLHREVIEPEEMKKAVEYD